MVRVVRPGLAILLSVLVVPAFVGVATSDPLGMVREVPCLVEVTLPLECPSGEVTWWTEHPGVGLDEVYTHPVLSEDGAVVYHVGHDLVGKGCVVTATATADGSTLWTTTLSPTGCSDGFDLLLDPTTGDLVLAAFIRTGPIDSSIHRIDAATGAAVWSMPVDGAFVTSIALDPDAGRIYAVGGDGDRKTSATKVQRIEMMDGAMSSWEFAPFSGRVFLPLEVTLDGDTLYLSGTSWTNLDGWWRDSAPAAVALDPEGDLVWSVLSGVGGFGARHALSSGHVFVATSLGIWTIDRTDGASVAIAPFARGTAWDDLVIYYDVAYEPSLDQVMMAGSRGPIAPRVGAALGAVAARGSDGALLWDRDLAASVDYAVAAPIVSQGDRVWFGGAVRQGEMPTERWVGRVGLLDAATGSILASMRLGRLPGDEVAPLSIVASDAGAAIVSGIILRGNTHVGFTARVTFAHTDA